MRGAQPDTSSLLHVASTGVAGGSTAKMASSLHLSHIWHHGVPWPVLLSVCLSVCLSFFMVFHTSGPPHVAQAPHNMVVSEHLHFLCGGWLQEGAFQKQISQDTQTEAAKGTWEVSNLQSQPRIKDRVLHEVCLPGDVLHWEHNPETVTAAYLHLAQKYIRKNSYIHLIKNQ